MTRKQHDGADGPSDGRAMAFDAVAEAIVLADPNGPTTFESLLRALDLLGAHTPQGAEGDTARDILAQIAVTAGRLMHGKSIDVSADMASLAHGFADVRRALEGGTSAAVREDEAVSDLQRAQPFEQVNPLADDPELIADFVTRASEHLDTADEHLLTLEREPGDREALDATFRVFHTIKGMAGFLGFVEIEGLAHETETLLDGPRKGEGDLTEGSFDMVFAAVDQMRGLVDARGGRSSAPSSAEALDGVEAGGPASGVPGEGAAVDSATGPDGDELRAGPLKASTQVEVSSRIAATKQSVVRVDEERLDRLLDTIGELVIAESMTSEAVRSGDEGVEALADRFARLDKITRQLQEMATSLRMVPLRVTFRTMARLVRDLSHKAGKDVELITVGQDTELDKAMVDMLADPLIHLLRNAVDHGIEDAAAREKAGKPATGRVELKAYHAGGTVCVEVIDDGRGLDAERILSKARRRGLVGKDETLSEREVFELIMTPGFSTAEKVTDMSGRGVGMDVVKRTADRLRGTIEIESTPGGGTRFVLRLPLTLAIIDGMVLRVSGERYIVPTLNIRRSVRPEPDQVSTIVGRGELLSLPEGLIPLVRLDRLFGEDGASQDPSTGIVVIVGDNGSRVGLVARELVGQQQTVIKPLGDGLADTPGVSGAAIMPDGTVGLILDVSGLVKLAHTSAAGAAGAAETDSQPGTSTHREGVKESG